MKYTIELSEQDIVALTQLQEDFAQQQEQNQAPYPNIYVLVDYEEIPSDEDYMEGRDEFYEPDGKIGGIHDLKEHLLEHFEDSLPKFLSSHEERYGKFDWEDEWDLEQLMKRFDINRVFIALVQKDKEYFLTYKDAENHLKNNHYRYHKDAFIDRRKPWRSPTTTQLIDILYRMNPNEM